MDPEGVPRAVAEPDSHSPVDLGDHALLQGPADPLAVLEQHPGVDARQRQFHSGHPAHPAAVPKPDQAVLRAAPQAAGHGVSDQAHRGLRRPIANPLPPPVRRRQRAADHRGRELVRSAGRTLVDQRPRRRADGLPGAPGVDLHAGADADARDRAAGVVAPRIPRRPGRVSRGGGGRSRTAHDPVPAAGSGSRSDGRLGGRRGAGRVPHGATALRPPARRPAPAAEGDGRGARRPALDRSGRRGVGRRARHRLATAPRWGRSSSRR